MSIYPPLGACILGYTITSQPCGAFLIYSLANKNRLVSKQAGKVTVQQYVLTNKESFPCRVYNTYSLLLHNLWQCTPSLASQLQRFTTINCEVTDYNFNKIILSCNIMSISCKYHVNIMLTSEFMVTMSISCQHHVNNMSLDTS